ncbi:MAG: hypothetical protein HQL46_04460 [Gammaproteobacteria bacterium]|nr:hypothetical protein [Gammaproteobacteria bacterium]
MKKTLLIATFSVLLLSQSLVSASDKQSNNSLIVYNSDIGLVHENKEISIAEGYQSIVYEDVAHTVQTDSVNVKFPQGVKVFSQQYRFDNITLGKLLTAHIGETVKVNLAKDGEPARHIFASLLAVDDKQCIVKNENEDIFAVDASKIIFAKIPKSLITKPSLVWNIHAEQSSKPIITLDYLIKRINWQSNYVLNLNQNIIDLSGWITIDNHSGKQFDDIKLHVLAGDINRVNKVMPRAMYRAAMTVENDVVSRQAHEGYHFYSIPFPVTLANNEKTQIKFIDLKNIPVQRRYQAQLNHPNDVQAANHHKVNQYLDILSLDIPLPAGIVRSYSNSQSTSLLLAENQIQHTPKHEKISLRLGTNFDLKVTETLLQQNDDKYYFERLINYKVKNPSNSDKTVDLIVPYFNNIHRSEAIIETSQAYQWKNGNQLLFTLTLNAGGSANFDVQYRNKKN